MFKENAMWHSEASMESSRGIAEEHTAMAATLSHLRHQKVLSFVLVN